MSFKDILGQEKPVKLLKKYVRVPTLSGAYLFTGEEGIGKSMAARTFAKAVNCLEQGDDSCDRCVSCLKIEKMQHPDFHYIGPSDSDAIKIELVRELKKSIMLRPYEGRKKVFIIDDAHTLTADASNALLKVLEEPPRDSLIILVTSKPGLLFKTVVSRCRVMRFLSLPRTVLEATLKKDYGLETGFAHFLAYFCEGRLGYALRLKETDIVKEKNKVIDDFIVSDRPGALEHFSARGRQGVRNYLNIVATWYRDLYLAKAGAADQELIHLDRREALEQNLSRYTWSDLEEITRSLSDALWNVERNVNIKLLLAHLKAGLYRG